MCFYTEVIRCEYANTSSASALKAHFERFCGWCWGHSSGNCAFCKKEYLKLYIPLRISEKQKELGLPQTKQLHN